MIFVAVLGPSGGLPAGVGGLGQSKPVLLVTLLPAATGLLALTVLAYAAYRYPPAGYTTGRRGRVRRPLAVVVEL
ncbi:hypothetical protein ACLF6K_00030 [Streptomyces xanthophaeus]|uniref:hypothetical protein n=1 Tax=Streptomyces xanthophaeus TaxID=67385 RepID=UPI00398FAF51